MNTAKLIEGMIPDELRLSSHPDGALVNEAIATVIAAMNDSDAITLAGQRADVRKTLLSYFNGTFSKHIAEEDEAWGKMKEEVASHKAKAERAAKTLTIVSSAEFMPEVNVYMAIASDAADQEVPGVEILTRPVADGWYCSIRQTNGVGIGKGNGPTESIAANTAANSAGYIIVGTIARETV